MKKLLFALLIVTMIAALSVPALAAGSTPIKEHVSPHIDDSEIEPLIKDTLNQYFTYYYDTLAGENNLNYDFSTVKNENTKMYQLIMAYEYEAKDRADCGISSYDYSLIFTEYDNSSDVVRVSLLSNFDFYYLHAEHKAAIHNIPYTFDLIKDNDVWKISSILSGHPLYENFLQKLTSQKSGKGVDIVIG